MSKMDDREMVQSVGEGEGQLAYLNSFFLLSYLNASSV